MTARTPSTDHSSAPPPPELPYDPLTISTVALWDVVPPKLSQVSVNVVEAVSGPLSRLPVVASAPDQPPLAIQPLALLELQVSIVVSPEATLLGLAVSVTDGAAGTPMVTLCVAEPPGPAQLSVNVVVMISGAVTTLSLVGLEPIQPSPAVQPVALVEDH